MNIIVDMNNGLRDITPSSVELTPMFIYFEHQGNFYPEKNWIDNPVVILGWWTYSIIELLKGGPGQGFSFMEGAFDMDAKVINENIEIQSEDGKFCWTISIEEFANSLITALKKASRLLYEQGHPDLTSGFNDDIKQIREALHSNRFQRCNPPHAPERE